MSDQFLLIAEIAFWVSVALTLYAYVGYPCALLALSLFRRRPVKRAPITPQVSLIIAARNEEQRIAEKLRNTLDLDYPAGALEIIVASDCSTDRTEEIVRSFSPPIRLVRASERGGKEAAQRLALDASSGQILIFSDVATALSPSALRTIVSNFADPSIGCVSSIDRFIDQDGGLSGEGAYVNYEMLLRRLETRVNSLVGLSGSFFAARRDVCKRFASDRQSDFNTLLNAVDMGLRGVLDTESVGYYRNIVNDRREFQRKVRTVVRGLFVLATNTKMLNPFQYGLFAWQLASHKLCRWLVPFALAVAALSNVPLASQSWVYRATLIAQCAFYAAAIAGQWIRAPALRVPAFFVLANLGVLIAWCRFVRGDRIAEWNPSDRLTALPAPGAR
jgi:glycosyltransferase involved in cell wall biosynthesis